MQLCFEGKWKVGKTDSTAIFTSRSQVGCKNTWGEAFLPPPPDIPRPRCYIHQFSSSSHSSSQDEHACPPGASGTAGRWPWPSQVPGWRWWSTFMGSPRRPDAAGHMQGLPLSLLSTSLRCAWWPTCTLEETDTREGECPAQRHTGKWAAFAVCAQHPYPQLQPKPSGAVSGPRTKLLALKPPPERAGQGAGIDPAEEQGTGQVDIQIGPAPWDRVWPVERQQRSCASWWKMQPGVSLSRWGRC